MHLTTLLYLVVSIFGFTFLYNEFLVYFTVLNQVCIKSWIYHQKFFRVFTNTNSASLVSMAKQI